MKTVLRTIAAAALLATGLAGCAAGPAEDPHEAFNRKMFAFDMALDKAVLRPAAKGYVMLPERARTGVHNVLVNLNEPVIFANLLLQGEPSGAGATLVRFVLDSSAGVGGLVDVGAHAGLPARDTDFGVTLGVWGVGEGDYLVLPLLGPAPPRDLAGRAVDTLFDPVTYFDFRSKFYYQSARTALEIVDTRARTLDAMDEIERSSIDFYAATRSLYLQNRTAQVRGDTPDTPDDPAAP